MQTIEHPGAGIAPVAAWLAAAVLAAACAAASALPPQETRTTYYATPAKKRIVGNLVLQCNGRAVRRGQETDFATTHTVRRCTGPVIPDPQARCELRPDGCADLPAG